MANMTDMTDAEIKELERLNEAVAARKKHFACERGTYATLARVYGADKRGVRRV